MTTSIKYQNNDPTFNAFLWSNAVIENAVTFFKLIFSKKVTICYSHILKQSALFKNAALTNNNILKTKCFV